MTRILKALAFLCILISQPSFAQSWEPYGEQTPDYAQDVSPFPPTVIGDGTTSSGGTPPAVALAPADPGSADSETGWTTSSGIDYTTSSENKFRTHCNVGFAATLDPIRGPGRYPYGHAHQFFGKINMDQNTDYKKLRSNYTTTSTCAGGTLNSTLYWFPCPMKQNVFGDGITRCKKADLVSIYYTRETAFAPRTTRFVPGLNMIGGMNMDDITDSLQTAEIAAANAKGGAAGYATRGHGGPIWQCLGGSYTADNFLANTDGTDALGNCSSSDQIEVSLSLPQCWDGKNLSSPGGYKHMRYMIKETNTDAYVCPLGWWQLAEIRIKISFSHQGAADYTKWRLSSDDAAAAACGCFIRNGESFHTDWMNGWKDSVMVQFQSFCNGLDGSAGKECANSTINSTGNGRLIVTEAAPDSSRNPQVNLTQRLTGTSASDWFTLGNETKARPRLRFRRH